MPTPKKGPRLGGSAGHQKHILSNLASQLFEHGAASLVAIFAQCISLPQRRKNVNRRCVCAHRLSEDLRLFTRAG